MKGFLTHFPLPPYRKAHVSFPKLCMHAYLFKDVASAEAYRKGEIIAGLRKCPICSAYDIETKVFDILPEHTKITHGPVD